MTILGGADANILNISDLGSDIGDPFIRVTRDRITGLAPAPINYFATGDFSNGINIWSSAGNDGITFESTLDGAITLYHANDGDDSVVVEDLDAGTDGLLVIYGEQGDDAIDASLSNLGLYLSGDNAEVEFHTGGDGRPVVDRFYTTNAENGGNDSILGGSQNDYLLGGAGADSLSGNLGDDALLGDGGMVTFLDERVSQIEATDLFIGDGDQLAGGAMNADARFGGDGNDVIIGGAGFDTLFGTLAEDILIFEYGRVTYNETGTADSVVVLGQRPLDLAASTLFDLYLKDWEVEDPYIQDGPPRLPAMAAAAPVVVSTGAVDTGRWSQGHLIPCQGQRIDLPDVNFSTGSARLLTNSSGALDRVADILSDESAPLATINGHTDASGDDAYNQRLSEQRAEAVRQYLISQGVDSGRIATRAFGESSPVGDNDSAEGRNLNRRVELELGGPVIVCPGEPDSVESGEALDALSESGASIIGLLGWQEMRRRETRTTQNPEFRAGLPLIDWDAR